MFSCYKFNINNFKGGMFGCFYSKNVFILFLLICDFFCCCGKQQYKIIVIGDKGVGKSTLIERKFHPENNIIDTTIFLSQEKTYNYPKDNPTHKFLVNEIYRNNNITENVDYRKANGIIAMYDITNENSFENLENKIKDALKINNALNLYKRKIPVIVVGNKSDLYEQRVVTEEEGEKFAKENDYLFFEAPAFKNDDNVVDTIFNTIAEKVIEANAEATKKTDIEKISGENNNIQKKDIVVNDVKKTCWCCNRCKNVN